MKHRSFLAVVVVSISFGGCPSAPKLKTLRVWPQAYCPQTKKINILMQADGDAYLMIDPPDKEYEPASKRVSRTEDARPMTVTADVERHHRADGGQFVVAPIPETRPMVGEAIDCDSHLVKTEPIPKAGFAADDFDPLAHVTKISNGCNSTDPDDPCPTITVCHGSDPKSLCEGPSGHSWTVPPGGSIDLPSPAGSMTGYWQLGRQLAAGEQCGPTAGATGGATATKPASQKMTHMKVTLHLSCDASAGATP